MDKIIRNYYHRGITIGLLAGALIVSITPPIYEFHAMIAILVGTMIARIFIESRQIV